MFLNTYYVLLNTYYVLTQNKADTLALMLPFVAYPLNMFTIKHVVTECCHRMSEKESTPLIL